MKKLSKSDTTPEMEQADADARESLSKKTCQHFAVGTGIVRNNIRGKVTGMTKDGGLHLWVEWEDETSGPIVNPAQRKRHRELCLENKYKRCPVEEKKV